MQATHAKNNYPETDKSCSDVDGSNEEGGEESQKPLKRILSAACKAGGQLRQVSRVLCDVFIGCTTDIKRYVKRFQLNSLTYLSLERLKVRMSHLTVAQFLQLKLVCVCDARRDTGPTTKELQIRAQSTDL
uniref:DUF4477 domain-containing protein n=1 Tax=Steinernema glaseri TaxID=37863 RepID=A0A1I7YDN0_9BILA